MSYNQFFSYKFVRSHSLTYTKSIRKGCLQKRKLVCLVTFKKHKPPPPPKNSQQKCKNAVPTRTVLVAFRTLLKLVHSGFCQFYLNLQVSPP